MNLLVFVGCLFVWIPSYITCLQLVVYVIPHFWKTSSISWEQIRLRLLKKLLGRGEEDPAFFQLLENHTEENLKLNLVSIWWWVHCRFPFSFCCSDIQLLCKGKVHNKFGTLVQTQWITGPCTNLTRLRVPGCLSFTFLWCMKMLVGWMDHTSKIGNCQDRSNHPEHSMDIFILVQGGRLCKAHLV